MQRTECPGFFAWIRFWPERKELEIFKTEEYKKNRKLVYLSEDAPAFCLYSKEIKQFGIEAGAEISDETYAEIIKLLSKRAKERALYLLGDMARTEHQLRLKLKDSRYPDEAVDYAVSYCRDKHYIDDSDFAMRFISSKSGKMSRRMIEKKLFEKGIDRDTIAKAIEDADIREIDTIRSLIIKKYGDIKDFSFEERQKCIRKLLKAGFSYDSISAALCYDDLT